MPMDNQETEISPKLRESAEKGIEQARVALGTLLDAARKAADTIQTSAKTSETPAGQAVARGFGFAEQNISSIFEFAQKLVRAPDLGEATKLQAEFVSRQASVMKEQVAELQTLTPAPEPTTKPADE
jgi:phasin